MLAREVKKLLAEGFRPVIFCRYIATAHYVDEELKTLLPERRTLVAAITGELTPEEREAHILRLGETDDNEGRTPVLVATDCLSEGVNLQHLFNAVIHYGENNPVDGAVLKVILRKAEKIRKELGVSVPMPADNNQVMETIIATIVKPLALAMLRPGGKRTHIRCTS